MGVPLVSDIDYANPLVVGDLVAAATIDAGPEGGDGTSQATAFLGAFNLAMYSDDFEGVVVVEKSFDGGFAWMSVARDVAGTPASYTLDFSGGYGGLAVTLFEPEPQVLWRVRCSSYTAGELNYRLSQGGGVTFTAYPGIGGPV